MVYIWNIITICFVTHQDTGSLWETSLQRSSTEQPCRSPTNRPGSRPSSRTRRWLALSSPACMDRSHRQAYRGTKASTGNSLKGGCKTLPECPDFIKGAFTCCRIYHWYFNTCLWSKSSLQLVASLQMSAQSLSLAHETLSLCHLQGGNPVWWLQQGTTACSHQDPPGGAPPRLPWAPGKHSAWSTLLQPICFGVGVDRRSGPLPWSSPWACAHPWVRWPLNP